MDIQSTSQEEINQNLGTNFPANSSKSSYDKSLVSPILADSRSSSNVQNDSLNFQPFPPPPPLQPQSPIFNVELSSSCESTNLHPGFYRPPSSTNSSCSDKYSPVDTEENFHKAGGKDLSSLHQIANCYGSPQHQSSNYDTEFPLDDYFGECKPPLSFQFPQVHKKLAIYNPLNHLKVSYQVNNLDQDSIQKHNNETRDTLEEGEYGEDNIPCHSQRNDRKNKYSVRLFETDSEWEDDSPLNDTTQCQEPKYSSDTKFEEEFHSNIKQYSDVIKNKHHKYVFVDKHSKRKSNSKEKYNFKSKSDYSEQQSNNRNSYDSKNYKFIKYFNQRSRRSSSFEDKLESYKGKIPDSLYEKKSSRKKHDYYKYDDSRHSTYEDYDYINKQSYAEFPSDEEMDSRYYRHRSKGRKYKDSDYYTKEIKKLKGGKSHDILNKKYPNDLNNFDKRSSNKMPFSRDRDSEPGELEPGEYVSENELDSLNESEKRFTPDLKKDFCNYDELLLLEKQRLNEKVNPEYSTDEQQSENKIFYDPISDNLEIVPRGNKPNSFKQKNKGRKKSSLLEDIPSSHHPSHRNSPEPMTVDSLKRLSFAEPQKPTKTVPLIKRLGLLEEDQTDSMQERSSKAVNDQIGNTKTEEESCKKLNETSCFKGEQKINDAWKNIETEKEKDYVPNSKTLKAPNKIPKEAPTNTILFSQEKSTGVESIKSEKVLLSTNDTKIISSNKSGSTFSSKSQNKNSKSSRHAKTAEKNKKDQLQMFKYLSNAASQPKICNNSTLKNPNPTISNNVQVQKTSKIEESPIRPNLDSRIQVLFGDDENQPENQSPIKSLFSPFSKESISETPLTRPPSPFQSRILYLTWFKETIQFRRNNIPPKFPYFDPAYKMGKNKGILKKPAIKNASKLLVKRLSFDPATTKCSSPQPLQPPPLPPPGLLPPSFSNIHNTMREVSEKIVPKVTRIVEYQKANTDFISKEQSTDSTNTPMFPPFPNTSSNLAFPPLPSEPPPPLPPPDAPTDSENNEECNTSKNSESQKDLLRLVLVKLVGELKLSLKRSLTDDLITEALPNSESPDKKLKLS